MVCLCPKKGQPLKEITLKPKEEIDVEVTFSPPSRVPQFSEEVSPIPTYTCIYLQLYHFQVIIEAYGQSQPLFVVKGSCHGIEISLDNNHVPFGAVVKSSQSSRRILLMNTGDIGARYIVHVHIDVVQASHILKISVHVHESCSCHRFKWDVEKFSPDFSISPSEGYILSGMEVG